MFDKCFHRLYFIVFGYLKNVLYFCRKQYLWAALNYTTKLELLDAIRIIEKK